MDSHACLVSCHRLPPITCAWDLAPAWFEHLQLHHLLPHWEDYLIDSVGGACLVVHTCLPACLLGLVC